MTGPTEETTYTCKYGTYTIKKSRFGLYTSIMDGENLSTGLTEDSVRFATEEIHLPVKHGEFDGYTIVAGNAVVEGKL